VSSAEKLQGIHPRRELAKSAQHPGRKTEKANATHQIPSIVAPRRRKELRPELREFLDACVIPALVEKFFAERNGNKEGR
jgi:hypothetical protein